MIINKLNLFVIMFKWYFCINVTTLMQSIETEESNSSKQ